MQNAVFSFFIVVLTHYFFPQKLKKKKIDKIQVSKRVKDPPKNNMMKRQF